ncbi:cell division protein FtsQ/DivIB [Acidocella sp.]|uniref:cell division protein FtsQ/DivIB n=1 Tax=Acidocella sp. TaxID=50710 RepID=UPI002605F540|nr:cell division protein FtsQ/DivIB [Acidocella sp.]
MPRIETLERPVPASSRAPRARGARGRKVSPPQDRLTQRALFFRRVKRSLKPSLWLLGAGAVLVAMGELVRSLPSPSPLALHKIVTASPAPEAPAAVSQPGILADALAGLGFRITSIRVIGASAVDQAAISRAIGVKEGEPSFGLSLAAIQQRVQALGPVQSATIERLLPGTLVVRVTERNAYAIWQTIQNGHVVFELIDKDGNIISAQDAAAAKRREPSLLLLSGAGAPKQAKVLIPQLQAQPTVFSHVAAAERVDRLRWNLILKNGTVVDLPAENQVSALAQLAALQNSMQLLDRPVELIDLRQAGRMVVRPYASAASGARQNRSDKRQERQ